MNTLLALIMALSSSAVLLAEVGKCPPVAPEVDLREALELRLGRRLAHFDTNLAKNISRPTVMGIRELRNTVSGISFDEEASILGDFRLISGKSVQSIPSRELAAHLEIMKSLKKIKGLLADAKDAAENRRSSACKLLIAEVVKEFAMTRKMLVAKSKIRLAQASKRKADTKAQPDAKAKKPDADMAVKSKKA